MSVALYSDLISFYCPFGFLCDCSVKKIERPAPHSQLDADLAGGMGMPDNGPKLMSA